MSGRINRPPEGEPFVWHTRELLESDAWRSAGRNVRRLIDFLEIEHMAHAGRQNGKLKAPRRQLAAHGIGRRLISKAIRDAEALGLVDCVRAGMRAANTYALTWLPHHDRAPASNRWRAFRSPSSGLDPAGSKAANLGHEGDPELVHEGDPDGQNLGHEGDPD